MSPFWQRTISLFAKQIGQLPDMLCCNNPGAFDLNQVRCNGSSLMSVSCILMRQSLEPTNWFMHGVHRYWDILMWLSHIHIAQYIGSLLKPREWRNQMECVVWNKFRLQCGYCGTICIGGWRYFLYMGTRCYWDYQFSPMYRNLMHKYKDMLIWKILLAVHSLFLFCSKLASILKSPVGQVRM